MEHPMPLTSFYDTVHVWRYGNSSHDVTIYYTVYNRGRGGKWKLFFIRFERPWLWIRTTYVQNLYTLPLSSEFSISGGEILWEQADGRDRRLTVETRYGRRFNITRRHRGGSYVCLFLQSILTWKKTCETKIISWILFWRFLYEHWWILDKRATA